ncbi:hypothetical protein AGABI2DRAFT_193287, partial [Agaricus bisporus var. bisporus H97]|uniref:hypothetical protein n=1 Tax=Agaricus bisporus var. bisporus (strain H97 / ATCC MYA-4626 / FGSC 10389) TaxID=936046 RepID=UPI00029F7B2A
VPRCKKWCTADFGSIFSATIYCGLRHERFRCPISAARCCGFLFTRSVESLEWHTQLCAVKSRTRALEALILRCELFYD